MSCFMCHTEHDEYDACPPLPAPEPVVAHSVVFEALFPGECSNCEKGISPGDRIAFGPDDEVVCVGCVKS